jgi:hypothetical protein
MSTTLGSEAKCGVADLGSRVLMLGADRLPARPTG